MATAALGIIGGAVASGVSQVIGTKTNQVVSNALGVDTPSYGGGGGGGGGGNTTQQILAAALQMGLVKMPGDIGKFFASGMGQALINMFVRNEGDASKLGDILKQLGISGTAKDMLEDVLGLTVLSIISDKYSEDAKNKLQGYQTQQSGAIDEMMTMARSIYPDDATFELDVQKRLDATSGEYKRARDTLLHYGAARGMKEESIPQLARLGQAESTARLEARRQADLDRQASAATAANVMGNTAQLRQPLIESAQQEYTTRSETIPALAEAMYQKYGGDKTNQNLQIELGKLQEQINTQGKSEDGSEGGMSPTSTTNTPYINPIYTSTEGLPYTIDPNTGEVEYQFSPAPDHPYYDEITNPTYTPVPAYTPVPEGYYDSLNSNPLVGDFSTPDQPVRVAALATPQSMLNKDEEERKKKQSSLLKLG